MAASRLKFKWNLHAEREVEIVAGDTNIRDRHAIFRSIRSYQRKMRTLVLRGLKQQGKTNSCIAAAKESSHFFGDGAFTKFKDWRFVHRARLSLVPLNAYTKPSRQNRGEIDRRCRRCGDYETLSHVLDHCMVRSTLYRKRHNVIVDSIKKAASDRWAIVGENSVVGTENLKPDLVVRKRNEIIIIDVTVPFENGLYAFDKARNLKLTKYSNLAKELSSNGNVAVVEAVVVGALGSWDSANDRVMRRICSKKYLKLFKKIVVS